MQIISPGRKPTLGEVIEYYTQDDFLNFLHHVLITTRVVTVIPTKLHWEPDWERDEIAGASVDILRDQILDKINKAYPKLALDKRPPYYPSFHQSVWRQIDPSNPDSTQSDCIFEADLPTWHDSFRDVGAAVKLMDQYGVRYRHKFSGHRSLHIVIPAEAIPHGYRGKGTQKLAQQIARWSHSAAHHLPKITRMPFSLNEDTGMVCLPIQRGGLAGFRPWMANLHLVRADSAAWQEHLTAADAEATTAFIEATNAQDETVDAAYFVTGWESIDNSLKDRLKNKTADCGTNRVWSQLAEDNPMRVEDLLAGMGVEDADTRWLTLEAYLYHGTTLNKSAINLLLTEEDEYARISAMDVLLRFEDDIVPYLVTLMGNFEHHSATGARAAYLLSMRDTLRQRVLSALEADSEKTFDAMIIAACLAGSIARDWHSAARILAPLTHARTLTARQQHQLQALDLMREMGGWNRKQGAEQAVKLAELGPDITDLLLLGAGSPERKLRRDVVSALAELADPRTVEHLVHALGDDYSKIRRKAIAALVRIGAPAVDALIEALGSDQAQIRGHAAVCLGQIHDPKAKQALMTLLDDEDENVRRRAIRSVRDYITTEDLPIVLAYVEKAPPEHANIVVETVAPLGEMGRQAMENLAVRTHNPNAAYFLAAQGNQLGRDILISLLKSEDETVRYAAIELLAELKDAHVVPFLAKYLQTLNHWRAMWYADKLGAIGTPEAVDALISGLDSAYSLTRRGAVRGLGSAKDPRAVPYLIERLSDEDGKVRSLAAEALIQIGEPGIAPLREALLADDLEGKRRRNRVQFVLEKLTVIDPK